VKLLAVFLLLFAAAFVDATTTRSPKTTAAFRKLVACPSTHKFTGACPGWIMDHMHSLRCGGLDVPENLWWQTVEESRLKDVQEAQCWRYYPK
jgi:hypothetical protein